MYNGCIIVTGASRGIGAAIAFELASAGYSVGCLSRSGELPAIANMSTDVSNRWYAVKCDVSQSAQLEAAFAEVKKRSGLPLVGLVNNAGIHSEGPVEKIDADEFRHVMDINVLSVLIASQTIYPHLLKNNGGMVINIGSFFDKLGIKHHQIGRAHV